MRNIKTYSPHRLAEALDILQRREPTLMIIAGGTDLLVQTMEKKREPRELLDISHIEELHYIKEEGDTIRIGALATHREVENSPLIRKFAPLLCEAIWLVGAPQLRNTATLVGNIANASPVADSVPPLMVLDATLTLKSARVQRKIPIRDYAVGPGRSVIESDELIIGVSFEKLGAKDMSFYERLGQRKLLSISKVGVAFKAVMNGKRMSQVAVALGAVAPKVIMAPKTAEFLNGKEYSREVAEEAARVAESESQAITDIRSTELYRNRMAGVLLLRGLARVIEHTIPPLKGVRS
jgi:xanthine dehydrogenase FAD-binding subunit